MLTLLRCLPPLGQALRGCITLGFMAWMKVSAATYYVAPTGDDSHSGAVDAPFASVQRAQTAAQPGDTVYIRGGRYAMREDQIVKHEGPYAYVTHLDKSGEPGKPIAYWAYPGEQPVFDFSAVKPAGRRVTAFRVDGSWLHLKGLEVVGVQVTIKTHTQSICVDVQGSHNVIEQLSLHDGMAIGVWIGGGAAHNLVLNCDAYRNRDPVSGNGRGGNVDGFGYHGRAGSVGNVFRGCRAWFNSDDGFDFINSAEVATIENCWAFYNGYTPDFVDQADGNGFKAGGHAGTPVARLPDPIPRHVVTGSVAVRNKANGFYANHHTDGLTWSHNTGYRNRVNFNLRGRERSDNATVIPGRNHVLKNNLGFAGGAEVDELNVEASDVSHNSFSIPLTITAADFVSLDETELTRPRKANGDLPDTAFLRLASGSVARDRGVDLGKPFAGPAPDLGAFEAEASQ